MKTFLRLSIVTALLAALLAGAGSAAAQGWTNVHVVQPGEYLGLIAQRYGTTVETLGALNGYTNPSRIYPGQRVILPSGTGGAVGDGTHMVRAGETLSGIAALYGTTVTALAQANNITDISRIYPGQRLVIYGTGGPIVTPAPSRVHTVQAGETLSRIAQAYGVTTSAIARTNGIANINTIYAGQRLVIPRLHTVQAGENLSRIVAYYGANYSTVLAINGIVNPNLIYPGQVLILP